MNFIYYLLVLLFKFVISGRDVTLGTVNVFIFLTIHHCRLVSTLAQAACLDF